MTRHKVSLHVVYGIPCVGKSTAAIQFAYHHGIRTVISTDYLREVQRTYAPVNNLPALAKVTHTAWELYGPPTRRNIEAGFVDHVNAVSPGVQAVAAKVVSDGLDAVIEGVHFHARLIEELRDAHQFADVQATLLIVNTSDELRQQVDAKNCLRAPTAALKRWHEHIPIMLTTQEFLIADAHAHRIQVVTADEWRSSWTRTRV